MGLLNRLFGSKQADTPSEIINDLKQLQINDLNRIIQILENDNEENFILARDTLSTFQNAFTTKFNTTDNYHLFPDEVRQDYLNTLSSVLTKLNDMNKKGQALGVSLFLIIMYAVEMEDRLFHNEIDQKLLKVFNRQ